MSATIGGCIVARVAIEDSVVTGRTSFLQKRKKSIKKQWICLLRDGKLFLGSSIGLTDFVTPSYLKLFMLLLRNFSILIFRCSRERDIHRFSKYEINSFFFLQNRFVFPEVPTSTVQQYSFLDFLSQDIYSPHEMMDLPVY